MAKMNGGAIYVLWLREVKKFFRIKARLIGSLATPLFFLVFLGFGLNAMSIPGIPSGVSYIRFLVPGIIGMALLFSSVFSGVMVITDRQFGFLKEIMVAPVSRLTIVLGRIAGGATTSMIQGLMLIVITALLGFEIISLPAFLMAIVFMILIATTFISIGLMFASKMKDVHGFQLVVNFLIFPLFFLSGALYPLNNLPATIKYISYCDPLTYGVDGLRGVLVGVSTFPIIYDFLLLVGFAVVGVLISAYLFEKSSAV